MARITLIVPTFPKTSETFIVSKFVGLTDRGLDVHIVAQTIDRAAWNEFPSLAARPHLQQRVHSWDRKAGIARALSMIGASMQVLGQKYLGYPRHILKGLQVRGWRSLGSFCTEVLVLSTGPDVIHFEFGSLATAHHGLAEVAGAKMSASFRGYDLNYVGLEDPSYYEQVWAKLDAAHFLGRDLYRRALTRGCPASLPYVLVPPSIDLQFFKRPPLDAMAHGGAPAQTEGAESRPLRVLSVGRLEWKKGYEFALSAIRRLLDQGVGVRYRIIGSGEYSEAIMFAIHQLELNDHVEVVGSASAVMVRNAMLDADVFLHSAVSEGFCNAVIEAQAMEIPVVTSDADGLAENIADGITGFVVPRRDPKAMADALARLARDPALRAQMGQAGRARAEQFFELSRQIDAFFLFYRSLAGEGGSK